jgi:CDP-diacylglycerol---serine O-phosphatidyltransferase
VSFPFATLAVGTVIYLASIPFGVARYRQFAQQDAAARKPAVAEAETPPAASEPPSA